MPSALLGDDVGVFAGSAGFAVGSERQQVVVLAVIRAATLPEADVVVSGIVGAAGLHGTWAAVEAGKRVAVANKETLVVAGPLVMNLAKKTGAEISALRSLRPGGGRSLAKTALAPVTSANTAAVNRP